MIVWEWMEEFQRQALEAGDRERFELPRLHNRAYKLRETDPAQALALLEKGSQEAARLREPWWVLFYDDWRVTAQLFFLRDFRNVLDLAVRNVLEIGKPANAQFPLRFSIQRNLIAAYLGIDPAGYADQIEPALEHLEREVPAEGGDKYLVQGSKREFALSLDRVDDAAAAVWQALRMAVNDRNQSSATHHATFNYSGLCEIAWKRGDMVLLDEAAQAGEEAARASDLQMELTEFLQWQAVVAVAQGQSDQAQSLAQRASERVKRLKMPPDTAYFDALSGYHSLRGDHEGVLAARRQELATLVNRGRHFAEWRCRFRICRTLRSLNRPFEDEREAAREVACRLKNPAHYLMQLQAI